MDDKTLDELADHMKGVGGWTVEEQAAEVRQVLDRLGLAVVKRDDLVKLRAATNELVKCLPPE